MQTILDRPFEEHEPYTLWWFFALECILIITAECFWQFIPVETGWKIPAVFMILSLYTVFQIIVPFYKAPRFDSNVFSISMLGIGFIILLAAIVYYFYQWPNDIETMSTGVFVIIGAHLFIALSNTLREPRPFLVIAPLWLVFIALTFGLSASLYYGMGWKQDLGLLSAGFVVSLLTLILFVLLLYFNWKAYHYLLYYIPRIAWLSWFCSSILFLKPLENPINFDLGFL
jgi:hypothetical protein